MMLPRARSWINYSYFFFVRYIHLQPADSTDRKHHILLDECRQTFKKELQKWKRRIASKQSTRGVLEGLDRRQRAQLAALMVDCESELGNYVLRRPYHKRLRHAELGVERNERMLRRKLTALHCALPKLAAI